MVQPQRLIAFVCFGRRTPRLIVLMTSTSCLFLTHLFPLSRAQVFLIYQHTCFHDHILLLFTILTHHFPSFAPFCSMLFSTWVPFLFIPFFSPVFLSFRWTGLWISSSLTAAWTSTTACFRSCCSSNTWCGASGTSGFTSRGQVRRWRDKTLPVLHQLLIKYSCRRTLNSSYHLFIQSTVRLAVVKQ